MKSIFVFMRNVNGVEHFAIGIGQLPQGCKQVGCFGSLSEAIAHRDRLRRGEASIPPEHLRRAIGSVMRGK